MTDKSIEPDAEPERAPGELVWLLTRPPLM